MLNPNSNRLNYGKIVSPPKGYWLDFAIGTTYSLNLDALIDLSLSLSLSQGTDSNLVNDPVILLDCLRDASEKVMVFCENGRMKLDNKPHLFHTLLEDMIIQVNNETIINGNYASFHPKFWLLRFVGEENKIKYKLIVLSRNLTYDRSWDISFTMCGQKTEEEIPDKNGAIIDFIKYLMDASSKESAKTSKTKKMIQIIEDLSHVKFELNSDVFDDYEFIVNGIDREGIQKSPLFNEKWNELFIMSPFLTNTVIKGFNERYNNNSKAVLVSRRDSLRDLNSKNCSNFEVYSLKDEIIKGEYNISDENSLKRLQDIHAKMYLIEYEGNTELYLGSLNASNRALDGNIEFMIRLNVRKGKFGIKQMIDDVFNGKIGDENNLFKKIENVEEMHESENGEKSDLDINDIGRLNIKGNIVSKDDLYDIELTVVNYDEIKHKDKLQIKPLLVDNCIDFSRNMKFEKVSKIDLSEFFILKIENKEIIIKIKIDGMPEDRKDYIVSGIIDSETKFLKLVAILLSDKHKSKYKKSGRVIPVNSHFTKNRVVLLPELYEKMLKAFLENPDKILGLDFLIRNVDSKNIPEDFAELYNTFLRARDKYGE